MQPLQPFPRNRWSAFRRGRSSLPTRTTHLRLYAFSSLLLSRRRVAKLRRLYSFPATLSLHLVSLVELSTEPNHQLWLLIHATSSHLRLFSDSPQRGAASSTPPSTTTAASLHLPSPPPPLEQLTTITSVRNSSPHRFNQTSIYSIVYKHERLDL